MEKLAKRLLFTNRISIGKDHSGNPIEAEGVFLNWLGRNLPFVVIGVWAAIVLLFAVTK
jgi:hypothetical protein